MANEITNESKMAADPFDNLLDDLDKHTFGDMTEEQKAAWREGQRTSADQGGGTLEEKINDILSHNGGYLDLKELGGFTDAEIESVGYKLEGEGEARDIVVREIDTKALEDKFDAIAKSEGCTFPKVAEIEALIDGPESKRALSDFLNGKINFYERLLNGLKWQRRPFRLDACMSELETLLVDGASDEDLKARGHRRGSKKVGVEPPWQAQDGSSGVTLLTGGSGAASTKRHSASTAREQRHEQARPR